MKLFLILLLLPTISFAKDFVPNSFSANFEQTVNSVTGKVNITSGKFDYKFPGHLRFEVTSPINNLIVMNPKKSWLYQPAHKKGEKDQVHIYESYEYPLIKFLDSVKNGIDNSKLFITKYDKNDAVLTFNKTVQKDMGIEGVTLRATGMAKDVKEFKGFESIILNNGKQGSTIIKLLDFTEDVSFSSNNFEFSPSANTKIITN